MSDSYYTKHVGLSTYKTTYQKVWTISLSNSEIGSTISHNLLNLDFFLTAITKKLEEIESFDWNPGFIA